MSDQNSQLLALSLVEIRTLLAGYLGSTNEVSIEVRIAAHLAYALHNEAESVCKGASYDIDQARKKIAAIDTIFGVPAGTCLLKQFDDLADRRSA